jgi:hypothetical protein
VARRRRGALQCVDGGGEYGSHGGAWGGSYRRR